MYVEASDRGFPSRKSFALVLVKLVDSSEVDEDVAAESVEEEEKLNKTGKVEKVQVTTKRPVATVEKVQLKSVESDEKDEENKDEFGDERTDDAGLKVLKVRTIPVQKMFSTFGERFFNFATWPVHLIKMCK